MTIRAKAYYNRKGEARVQITLDLSEAVGLTKGKGIDELKDALKEMPKPVKKSAE